MGWVTIKGKNCLESHLNSLKGAPLKIMIFIKFLDKIYGATIDIVMVSFFSFVQNVEKEEVKWYVKSNTFSIHSKERIKSRQHC